LRKALIGPKNLRIGEIVKYWNWGGVDLQFDDGEVITYANDDVEEVTEFELTMMTYPSAGMESPFGQVFDFSGNKLVDGEHKK
jgi:hypothetical protein